MKVKDIIKDVESKSTSIAELASKHNVSDRTVQNKIKKLGFRWMPKESKYEYLGEDIEKASEIEWESLFIAHQKQKDSESIVKKEEHQSNSKTTATIASNNKSENANRREDIQKVNVKGKQQQSKKQLDSIDIILANSNVKVGRTYRGYYFDSDILAVIDSVQGGNKSDLINECLRKVFTEKGIL